MVCRNAEKANAAADEFKSAFSDPAVHIFICDLSSVTGVKQLAEKLKEQSFATNHLAYFQLTNELLPVLQAAASARIVNVASQVSKLSRLNFNNLQLFHGNFVVSS